MINNFIFTLGLPGSGKSTYIAERYKGRLRMWRPNDLFNDCEGVIIEADAIKRTYADYDDEHPELVHQRSVDDAKKLVEGFASDASFNGDVLMDGGGINNHYTLDIISYVREHSPNAKVKCVFFDTPVDVCVSRISKRDRKVPLDAVYDKNIRLVGCLNRIIPLVDEVEKVIYYTNKHLFLDMDGTIVTHGKARVDADGNTDFVNGEMFRYAKPVRHVIDFVRTHFDMSEVYIVTACANSIVLGEKLEWMATHFPEVPRENILWVGNKDWKHVFLKQFAKKNRWSTSDMTIIDDNHPNISKCSAIGMNAVHVSSIDLLFDDTVALG